MVTGSTTRKSKSRVAMKNNNCIGENITTISRNILNEMIHKKINSITGKLSNCI